MIDDPELLRSKKNLTAKMTPMSLVFQLIAKLPPLCHARISQSNVTESKDAATQRSVWYFKVGFLEQGLVGEAADFNKQNAKQIASQKFLKLLFPETQTWAGLCRVIPLYKGIELVQHLKPCFRALYEAQGEAQ